jgi:hypothetical protein
MVLTARERTQVAAVTGWREGPARCPRGSRPGSCERWGGGGRGDT